MDSFKKKLTKASKKNFTDNATGGDIVSHKEHSGVQTPRPSLCNMHMLLNIKSKTLVGIGSYQLGLVRQVEGLVEKFPPSTLHGKKMTRYF